MQLLETIYKWPTPEIEAQFNQCQELIDKYTDSLASDLNKSSSQPWEKHRAFMNDPHRNYLIELQSRLLVLRIPTMIFSLNESELAKFDNGEKLDYFVIDDQSQLQ